MRNNQLQSSDPIRDNCTYLFDVRQIIWRAIVDRAIRLRCCKLLKTSSKMDQPYMIISCRVERIKDRVIDTGRASKVSHVICNNINHQILTRPSVTIRVEERLMISIPYYVHAIVLKGFSSRLLCRNSSWSDRYSVPNTRDTLGRPVWSGEVVPQLEISISVVETMNEISKLVWFKS